MNQSSHAQADTTPSAHVSRHRGCRCKNRSNAYIRLIVLLVFAWALFAGEAALAQEKQVYTDTEFDVTNDWTVFGPYVTREDSMNAAFSAKQVSTGGNHMEVGLTRATVDSGEVYTWGAVINDTLIWDPSEEAQGPIGKIDLQFDLDGGGAWSLAVSQDGYVWMAIFKRHIRKANDFIVISIDGLEEQDFVALPGSEVVFDDQPLHPDFSADGTPISFGIGVGISCPSTSNCTTIVPVSFDVDNLQVTVYPYVPLNAGHNGNWWGGAPRQGEGVQLEVGDDGGGGLILVATVYSYDDEGNQIFMISVGPVNGDTAQVDVFITDEGLWGDDFDPELVKEAQWGTGTITACGCEDMVMDLRPNADYMALGYTNLLKYKMVRLITPAMPCVIENPN